MFILIDQEFAVSSADVFIILVQLNPPYQESEQLVLKVI
jgi:hypothetical protein